MNIYKGIATFPKDATLFTIPVIVLNALCFGPTAVLNEKELNTLEFLQMSRKFIVCGNTYFNRGAKCYCVDVCVSADGRAKQGVFFHGIK